MSALGAGPVVVRALEDHPGTLFGMRTPLRELLRSLIAGVEPRGRRRIDDEHSFGVHVEAQGFVTAYTDHGGVLDVVIDGQWVVTDLDADGIPVRTQTSTCSASIALGAEWSDVIFTGAHVTATSLATLQGLLTTVATRG